MPNLPKVKLGSPWLVPFNGSLPSALMYNFLETSGECWCYRANTKRILHSLTIPKRYLAPYFSLTTQKSVPEIFPLFLPSKAPANSNLCDYFCHYNLLLCSIFNYLKLHGWSAAGYMSFSNKGLFFEEPELGAFVAHMLGNVTLCFCGSLRTLRVALFLFKAEFCLQITFQHPSSGFS